MTDSIQTTIASLLERHARVGLVNQNQLLDAVVGLMEYAQGLERRLAAMEREYAYANHSAPRTAFGWSDHTDAHSIPERRTDPLGEA